MVPRNRPPGTNDVGCVQAERKSKHNEESQKKISKRACFFSVAVSFSRCLRPRAEMCVSIQDKSTFLRGVPLSIPLLLASSSPEIPENKHTNTNSRQLRSVPSPVLASPTPTLTDLLSQGNEPCRGYTRRYMIHAASAIKSPRGTCP